ncbi:spermidine synthase [Phenylobacterium deserti]|uniref:Spermidine synthase n=1 Tax=Phenylobacterium deserti TaxID=1914756 RepID=A0A328ASP3_9CAUL|nr:spermidine synthase [Phenylobacterium deserti]RAK56534.1 spermidine synthase [Phenylobacterium deserti]
MIRWEHLDTAQVPGGDELKLMRRGAEYSIMAGPIELMNSRMSGSEQALATLSCERIAGRKAPRLLIGGLGMGFTLRAALAHAPADAQITVAELVPAVVAWARGPLAHIFEGSLEDPRVTVFEGDVAEAIGQGGWDAILLDVDNGPGGLSREENDGLYDPRGLGAAKRALRLGGVLAVWSAAPDAPFSQRLRRAGFQADEVRVNAHRKGRGARHVVWLASVGQPTKNRASP